MNPPPTSGDRQLATSELRLSMRAATKFLLDAVTFAAMGRSLIDTLILLAIVQANVTPIIADPELQRRFGAIDSPPLDELRRPISINAIAASLQLPFETVRRRVQQMARAGACEITTRGVVAPQRGLSSPVHNRVLETNYLAVRDLYLRLRRAGGLPPPSHQPPAPAAPLVRAVARISSDFVLRLTAPLVAISGNLIDGLALMAVFDINTAALPDVDEGEQTAAGFVPDARRRPATVRSVAERLGLPYEQTRRRLAALEAQGRCTRVEQGFIVPIGSLVRDDLMQAYVKSIASLHRMFAALAELGVLTEWEDELAKGRS